MAKLHEYRRVIGIGQVLYLAGRKLKRQGIKYTTLAGIIGITAILVDIAGDRIFGVELPFNKLNAAMFPALVALITFGLGNGLIGLSNLFSSERLLMADANSMNLMEDRKKTDMDWHLEVLWDRVFKYEASVRNGGVETDEAERINGNRARLIEMVKSWDEGLKGHFGIDDENLDEFAGYIASFRPLSKKMETTKEGFVATARFALDRALPQKHQEKLIGFDLSLLEDWYDGAFFTLNDCKVQEQFAANKTIRGLRESIGIPWSVKTRETLFGYPVPLWYGLTMKKIGTCVGTLIGKMNKKYVRRTKPNFFDAQDFLWKDRFSEELVVKRFGKRGPEALQEMLEGRRKMFRNIFSNHRKIAHTHVFRMFGRDFARAMDMRLDYDIEFAAGLLDNKPDEDVRELASEMMCIVYPPPRADRKCDIAAERLAKVDAFLAEYIPEAAEDPAGQRAARIGYMINRRGIRQAVETDPKKAEKIFRERIIASKRRYNKRICLLRQHYELARMQLLSYVRMVDELAEYE